jgi:hypothetical protein
MTTATKDSATVLTLGRGFPTQREFRLVRASRFDQDVWMMNAARRAGLDKADLEVQAALIKDTDALDAYLTRVVTRIFEADAVCDLLAGVLVPVQGEWSPKHAASTSVFLATLTDTEEKQILVTMLTQVVGDFLSSGRNS